MASRSRSRRSSWNGFVRPSETIRGRGGAGRKTRRSCTKRKMLRSHRIRTDTPRAMVYGLLRDLLGEPCTFATVACGIASTDLTPASGCRNHTTSPSANKHVTSTALSASTAFRPTSVTFASAPLEGRNGNGYRGDFHFCKSEYFFKRDWTGQITLIRLNKLDFACKSESVIAIQLIARRHPERWPSGLRRPLGSMCVA
jgi:hypothetical protein